MVALAFLFCLSYLCSNSLPYAPLVPLIKKYILGSTALGSVLPLFHAHVGWILVGGLTWLEKQVNEASLDRKKG